MLELMGQSNASTILESAAALNHVHAEDDDDDVVISKTQYLGIALKCC